LSGTVYRLAGTVHRLGSTEYSLTGTVHSLICIIVWGTFLLKMCHCKIVYIYMHSALTGVKVLVTRTPEYANRLSLFFQGLFIVTTGDCDRNITFRWSCFDVLLYAVWLVLCIVCLVLCIIVVYTVVAWY
jgi:hypothetical protein